MIHEWIPGWAGCGWGALPLPWPDVSCGLCVSGISWTRLRVPVSASPLPIARPESHLETSGSIQGTILVWRGVLMEQSPQEQSHRQPSDLLSRCQGPSFSLFLK